MALQKAFTDDTGVALASAYHKIMSASFERFNHSDRVSFEAHIYKDDAARQAGKKPVFTFSRVVRDNYPVNDFTTFFDFSVLDTVDKNIVSQCYAWMKTQDDLYGIDYTADVTDV